MTPMLAENLKDSTNLTEIELTADAICFGFAAAWYAGGGGDIQALPQWGGAMKRQAITDFRDGRRITWTCGLEIRHRQQGVRIHLAYDALDGGKDYDVYWFPLSSFKNMTVRMMGEKLT